MIRDRAYWKDGKPVQASRQELVNEIIRFRDLLAEVHGKSALGENPEVR